MKVIENAVIIEVTCLHPDDSPRFYRVAVEDTDWPFIDEDVEAWEEDVKKTLTDRFNNYGYWHELEFVEVRMIEDKIYRTKMN